MAVNRNAHDSQILLGRPTLKDFKINILNDIDSWEFDQKPKVTKVSPCQFAQEISATACMFEIHAVFRPFDDNTDPWEDKSDCPIDLSNVPEWLCQRFRDFFNIHNADWLAPHRVTDHAIDLKPNTKPPYIHIYNMSPAELKALNDYL